MHTQRWRYMVESPLEVLQSLVVGAPACWYAHLELSAHFVRPKEGILLIQLVRGQGGDAGDERDEGCEAALHLLLRQEAASAGDLSGGPAAVLCSQTTLSADD